VVTAHLKNGKSIKSLGDAIQLGAAELILRTTVANSPMASTRSITAMSRTTGCAAVTIPTRPGCSI
jgi:hypothetical protein